MGWSLYVLLTVSDMIPNTSYLSRMAVIFAFPFPCMCGYVNQFVWFFKRQRGISREWFTSFFKHNWDVRLLHTRFLIVERIRV